MNTICRTFEFINYNIPPNTDEHSDPSAQKFNYTTIGFFDALKTELIENPATNRLNDSVPTLDAFCRKNESYALHLDGRYSYQNTLGIRQGSVKDDDSFWKADHNLPLCFVVFFQLKKYDRNKVSGPCTLEIMEDSIGRVVRNIGCSSKNMKYLCYQTLDKNDFVIGIKSNLYHTVSDLLLEIHRVLRDTYPILYSYSIFSIHNDFLNSIKYRKESLERYKSNTDKKCEWLRVLLNKKEIISSISLQGVTSTEGAESMEEKYRTFVSEVHTALYALYDEKVDKITSDRYHLYDTIGDYDFRYIAREVPLVNLLHAMVKEGPLNYSSSILRKNLFSSLLVLNIASKDGWEMLTAPSDSGFTFKEAKRCGELREHLLKWGIANRILDQNGTFLNHGIAHSSAVHETLFISLWKVLVSLAALERAPSQRYDFETLYWPYRHLIELLTQTKLDDPILRPASTEEQLDWDELVRLPRLIQSLSTVLHSTLRTDIQFFQVNDFNVFVNYAPAKLRAFYSAWIQKLVRYYSLFQTGNAKHYEFVISMNNFPGIQTRELKHNNRKTLEVNGEDYRIMYIELPERMLYKPELTSIMLGHEIAHFGGGFAKRRSEDACHGTHPEINRLQIFLQCLSSWYALLHHSEIMTELYERSDKNLESGLLLLITESYLEEYLTASDGSSSKKKITDTVIYQNVLDYLNQMFYSNGNPHSVSGLNAALGSDAIILARQYLDTFMDMRSNESCFNNSRIAGNSMALHFKGYLMDHWDEPEWREIIEDYLSELSDEPLLWTDRLLNQLLDMFEEVSENTVSQMDLQRLNIRKIPYDLMDLLRESHADLMAILSMRLTPDKYFDVLLETNHIDQQNSASDSLDIPFAPAARILVVIQTMKGLAEIHNELSYLIEWANLDWLNGVDPSNKKYNSIYQSLIQLWDAVDDTNYFFILGESWREAPRFMIYICREILALVKKYLTACGEEVINQPATLGIAQFIKPILSADIYEQMRQINQSLWDYEVSCENTYHAKKGIKKED